MVLLILNDYNETISDLSGSGTVDLGSGYFNNYSI